MTQFEVEGTPLSGEVDKDGNFKFFIQIANSCGGALTEATDKLVEHWWSDEEVFLTVHMTVKGIYQELFDWFTDSEGKIDSGAMPNFRALRNNCQWIINQIDALKIRTPEARKRMINKHKALQLLKKNKIKIGDVVGGLKLIDVGNGLRWVKCEKLE